MATLRTLAGATAIVTGANGGLGTHLTRALAAERMNLLLVAYPGLGLEELRDAVRGVAPLSEVLVADLRIPEERARVVETATRRFGGADLLVNNAGVEYSSALHDLSLDQLLDVLRVNLEAPIDLTRRVLVGMLERGRGHIVNISSLAGKSGPGFQEPYAATKAGLSAFTLSLRSTYRGTGVSASAVTPGFVEAGIYSRLKRQTGRAAPRLLGSCSPEDVCRAMLRAIRQDAPEILLTPHPVRPILALSALAPRFGEWFTERIGVNEFFRQAARHPGAAPPRPSPGASLSPQPQNPTP